MKKIKWIVLGGLFTVLLFLSGVYIGNIISNSNEGFESNTIAIVNLDEGVHYETTNRYFSNELMDMNNTQYKITGLQDARNGLDSGLYAAYIVISANFSRNVVTVNEIPTRIEISYQISDKLVEESKEKAIYNVLNFKTDLNNKLSNVYLYSVLNRFHDGQDGATTVIQNDQTDLDLILNINAADLVHMVNITDVDAVDNGIEALNIENEVQTGGTLMNDLDTSYKGFMNISAEELAQIKVNYHGLNTSVTAIENKVPEFTNIINPDGSLAFTLDNTNTYITDSVTAMIAANNATISTAVEDHNQELADYRTDYVSLFNNEVSQIQSYETNIQNAVFTYLAEEETRTFADALIHYAGTGELNDDIENFLTAVGEPVVAGDDVVNQYFLYYRDNVVERNQRQDDYRNQKTNLLAKLDDLPVIDPISIEAADISNIEAKVKDDINDLYTEQTTVMSDLQSYTNGQRSSYDGLLLNIDNYDPLSNINERTIEQLVKNYHSNTTDMERAIIKKEDEYKKLNQKIYENSYQHISSIKEDVGKANEESNTKVEEGIGKLQVVKEKNSIENQHLLNNFLGTLLNTRQGTLTNTEVTNFMTNPINLNGAAVKNQAVVKNIGEYVEYGLLGTLGLTIVTMSAILITSIRKKHKEKE